jgi:uncharacterized iron-regulated protein
VSVRRGWTAAALLLAGCAAPLWLPADGDSRAQTAAIVARAREAEVIYLGEEHDNPHHHVHQRQVLEAMLAAGARPALAFEMLDVGQQGAVERAVSERLPSPMVADRLHWKARGWPDFEMYWPLFDLAERYGLDVVAADLDPAVARRIAREGLAAAGAARADLASLLPPDAAREAAIARTIRDAHCNLLPESRLPFMVESWHARNVTMARRIAQALERHRQVVVIVGGGHQEPGGLPAQLEALRPGARQLVVEMAEESAAGDSGAVSARADIVWLTPAVERPDPCGPLRTPAHPRK